MGLRIASEHLVQAQAALDSAVAALEVAAANLASRKRRRLSQSLDALKTEIATIGELTRQVAQKRRRKRTARLNDDSGEDDTWEDDEDVIAEIFAEAQERYSAADNSRDSLGEEPPSWHDAVNRIERR